MFLCETCWTRRRTDEFAAVGFPHLGRAFECEETDAGVLGAGVHEEIEVEALEEIRGRDREEGEDGEEAGHQALSRRRGLCLQRGSDDRGGGGEVRGDGYLRQHAWEKGGQFVLTPKDYKGGQVGRVGSAPSTYLRRPLQAILST